MLIYCPHFKFSPFSLRHLSGIIRASSACRPIYTVHGSGHKSLALVLKMRARARQLRGWTLGSALSGPLALMKWDFAYMTPLCPAENGHFIELKSPVLWTGKD
jgi:hypothetical protein